MLILLIVASTLLRLALAASLGPGNDEAYHYLFATHPDWSYFDHPPMVALIESFGLAMGGFHAAVLPLRLGFVVLAAGSTWLMARMTGRQFGPYAGLLAACALNATSYFGVAASTFALPDGPLLFFWVLTLDRLLLAFETPERLGPWIAVGLAWGGAMLSKYQAVLLPVATLAFLMLGPRTRSWLRRPGPYVATLVGLLVFSPVIGWNAARGWASFAFQGGRALDRAAIRPEQLVAFVGGQAAYLFPWVMIPLAAVLARQGRRLLGRPGSDLAGAFLAVQALVPLFLFAAIASTRAVLPHWSLPAWLAVFPLLGRCWAERLAVDPGRVRVRVTVLALLTIVLTCIVVLQARTGFLQGDGRAGTGVIPAKGDPTADFYGWDQVAREVKDRGLLDDPRAFLFSDRWYVSGHLAFATDGKVPVACYNRRHAQGFASWSRPGDWVGRDGIFVGVNDCESNASDLSRWFLRFESLGAFPVLRNGVPIRVIHLYRGVDQSAPFPFGNAPSRRRVRSSASGSGRRGCIPQSPPAGRRPRPGESSPGCRGRTPRLGRWGMFEPGRSVAARNGVE